MKINILQNNAKFDKICYIENYDMITCKGGDMDQSTIHTVTDLYEDLPSAAVLFDSEDFVLWKNAAASARLSEFLDTPAFKKALFTDAAQRGLAETGTYYARPGAEFGDANGVMLTRVQGGVLAVFDDALRARVSRTGPTIGGLDCFSGYVRGNIDRIALASSAAESMVDSDDPEIESLFSNIRLGGYRILRAMNNTALVSRYLTGNLSLVYRCCNVNELTASLCASVESVASRHIKISLQLPKETVLANMDVHLFERALLNVLANSHQFSRENNRIEVTLSQHGSQILLTVRDEGAGIKDENVPFVVQPYFSCEPADDGGVKPGLGLGLTVASIFCETHGGVLVINSRFGEGTTVALNFQADAPTGEDIFSASVPVYVTDRFSPVYVEFCELCEIPK